jgi:hypothetical protein
MDKEDGGREWEVVMFLLSEPRGMVAKDCMESNKGAAGSGIKNEMGEQGCWDLTLARRASHQTGSDRWWAVTCRELSLGTRKSRLAHLRRHVEWSEVK